MYFWIILVKRRFYPYFYLICLFKFIFFNKSSAERSMWAANRPAKLHLKSRKYRSIEWNNKLFQYHLYSYMI